MLKSKKYLKSILLSLIITSFIFFPNIAKTEFDEKYSINDPITIDNVQIKDNITEYGAESKIICKGDLNKSFNEISECSSVCKDCVYGEDGCWRCVDSNNEKSQNNKNQDTSWWKNFKNFLNKIILFVGNIFNKKQDKKLPAQKEENNKLSNVANDIFLYNKKTENGVKDKDSEKNIEKKLIKEFNNANSISELLKLRSLMLMYCSDKAMKDYEKEKVCNDKFMDIFRKKGDELKEKLFAEIEAEKGDPETYKKIRSLYVILMAGENAAGEGVWFSTDNIKKIRNGLKNKGKVWFNSALDEIKIEELFEWYSLAMAYTSASGSGSEILEGINPLKHVRDQAEVLIAKKLFDIDLCDPDLEKLKYLQSLPLFKDISPSCEELLKDSSICSFIEKGNIEIAYARLYEKIIKKFPERKSELPPPIDCNKKTEIEYFKENDKELDINKSDFQNINDEIKSESKYNDDQFVKSDYNCEIVIFPEELIGWKFEIHNCERKYSSALSCFEQCGSLPPMILSEDEIESFCYESINGSVDYNNVLPCEYRLEPDINTIQCVEDCLNQ